MSHILKTICRNAVRAEIDCGNRPHSDLAASQRWVAALKAGKILFYDCQEVPVGLRKIDWTGKHVHHQEWPAQLNRFFWLPHLADAYAATGDEELPALARRTIEDWIDHHDYSADQPPSEGDNTLNISIRLGQFGRSGWWGTIPAFAMSPHYDEAFVRRMIESTRGQLACLQAHLSPRSNWRISHLNCLLYCGVVVPGLEEYVPFAVRHLNETFHRQIHDDGSHEEHTPGYHGWMCRLFTMLWRLARARPELGLRIATDRMVRMWDYTVYSTAPDGGSAGLHDSGAWSQGPGRIGAIAERDAILQEAGMNGRAEWDITKRPSRHFPDAGQVFLRDDWSPDATFIAFDATRWGGGHCHLSRLAVSLYAGTRMLLYDPGIFSYEMSDPYAPYGKATRSHNTIHLGGMNQTEVDPDTRKVHLEDDLAVVASCYGGGYFPGEYTWSWPTGKGAGVYGVHDRVLLWLRGRGVLVFDHIRTDGNGQPFAAHWQFPAGPAMLDTAQRCAWTSGARDNILVRCIDSSIPLDLRIHEGEKDPILGWLPDAHPHYRPAPLIAMGGRAQSLGTTMVTLLYPFRDDRPPEIGIERFERCTGQPYGFRFTWPDGTEDLVACSSRLSAQVNQAGPVESDGTLAVITLRGGEPSRAFLLDGMFLRFQDRDLIRRDAAGTWRVHFSA